MWEITICIVFCRQKENFIHSQAFNDIQEYSQRKKNLQWNSSA